MGAEKNSTGMNLYLALLKLDLMLAYGERARIEPDAVVASGIAAFHMACISDVRMHAGAELSSQLSTAAAVGVMLVNVAVAEGVILEGQTHGLGVRLHVALSADLSALLSSFNSCLGYALLHLVGSVSGVGPAASCGRACALVRVPPPASQFLPRAAHSLGG